MKEVAQAHIKIYRKDKLEELDDLLAAEAPLEVELRYFKAGEQQKLPLVLLMRSPGKDKELVTGFLLSEGIIRNQDDVERFQFVDNGFRMEEKPDKMFVILKKEVEVDGDKLERNFLSSSSCGLCGKDSMESLNDSCFILPRDSFKIEADKVLALKQKLNEGQNAFSLTGGLHAVGLINEQGEIEILCEDVGRHNALDKVIGSLSQQQHPPFYNKGLLLSGRTSYEMVHKALMLGFPFIVSIGAPSSLAVNMAEESDLTLVGFLKENRMNIYSAEQRIVF